MDKVIPSLGEQDIVLDNMAPNRILRHILEEFENSKDYTYMIMGNCGPTGKTWLCEGLRQYGYNAVDLNDIIFNYVIYRYRGNHYHIDHRNKTVIIVLNKFLEGVPWKK